MAAIGDRHITRVTSAADPRGHPRAGTGGDPHATHGRPVATHDDTHGRPVVHPWAGPARAGARAGARATGLPPEPSGFRQSRSGSRPSRSARPWPAKMRPWPARIAGGQAGGTTRAGWLALNTETGGPDLIAAHPDATNTAMTRKPAGSLNQAQPRPRPRRRRALALHRPHTGADSRAHS